MRRQMVTSSGRCARNAKTGKVIHNKLVFEIKSPQKSPVAMNSYASCTPVIEEGRVYVTSVRTARPVSTPRPPRSFGSGRMMN